MTLSVTGLYCFLTLLWLLPLRGSGAEPADTLSHSLGEVSVSATGKTAMRLLDGGDMRYNTTALSLGVRNLGESDVVNVVKRLSGVVTAGDYGTGLMVDGAETSQTLCRIAKVPVFFPYRFGGIFSTFNTPHFASATFSRSIHDASMPSRLGGRLDFQPYSEVERPGGSVNVGLIASSATLRMPLGRRFSAIVSGRVSYIDRLYGQLLSSRHNEISYNFADLNADLNYAVDDDNRLSAHFFYSNDRLGYDDSYYALDSRLKWHNTLVSLAWHHTGRVAMEHRVYYSGFSNILWLELPQMRMDVPSSIGMAGVAGDLRFPAMAGGRLTVTSGYELQAYRNKIQSVSTEGYGADQRGHAPEVATPVEGRVYAGGVYELSERLRLSAGVSLSGYAGPGDYNAFFADPRLTATYDTGHGSLSLHLGRYTQYLHQVGFSETGLSSDFWITAREGLPAQAAYLLSGDYSLQLRDAGVAVNLEAYVKKVAHQPEYSGQIIDLLDADYSAEKHIIEGHGYNAGVNLTVRKESGRLTGTIAAGYGVARRHYPGFSGWLCSRTDPGFTFSADADLRLGSHWNVGPSFRLASGRPYTPALTMYIIAGNLITEYGYPNSARMPLYHRLDLSATWHLDRPRANGGTVRHLVNISLINAYGRNNVEMRKYVLDSEGERFEVKEVSSLYRFLPSLSYTLQF